MVLLFLLSAYEITLFFSVLKNKPPLVIRIVFFELNYGSLSSPFFKFIFNRLSIVDLSPQAMQPMYSKRFNSWILFNGEIFNHRELRSFLEKKGVQFQTSHSDTEVLLNGISQFGDKFIDKIIGQLSLIHI